VSATTRPAFYALAPGGWRDYVTLLHPPYTAWHLSYVVLGAALAPHWRPGVLGLALAAFFLGMGVGAHALDELQGRPLQTRIGRRTLLVLATLSLLGAAAIGIVTAIYTSLGLVGSFIAVAYNLELFGGRFHGTLWFALGWGALPVLATYFAAAETIRGEAVAAAIFAALVSWTQRVLSTPVRLQRRQEGALKADGKQAESALRILSAAMVALAVALILVRVT
jgi:hypothetical protein